MTQYTMRRVAGLIIALVVVGICGFLIVSKDSGRSDATATAPTQSTPARPKPKAKSTPAPKPTQTTHESFNSRVLKFEASYLIADPVKRLSAIGPYATAEFLAAQPQVLGDSPAEQAAAKLTYKLDKNSWVDAELVDPDTAYVMATLGVTSYLNGSPVAAYQAKHETVWTKDADGQWRVCAESQLWPGDTNATR